MDAFLDDFGLLAQLVALRDAGLEAERKDAPPGLFLSRRGAWYHDGDRVKHAGLEGLLHRSIARDEDGKLLVTTGRDRMPFVAEDAPFFIRTLADGGRLVLSDGGVDDGDSFCIDERGHIRAAVKEGRFWALASRSAAQGLLALVDGDGLLRLPSGARALTPAPIDAALDWSREPSFVIT